MRPIPHWVRTTQEALRKAGIAVSGPLRVIRSGESSGKRTWTELGSVASPPVSELVRDMMKPSQNLHAQLLLLAVGGVRRHGCGSRGADNRGCRIGGIAVPSAQGGDPGTGCIAGGGIGIVPKNLATARVGPVADVS